MAGGVPEPASQRSSLPRLCWSREAHGQGPGRDGACFATLVATGLGDRRARVSIQRLFRSKTAQASEKNRRERSGSSLRPDTRDRWPAAKETLKGGARVGSGELV